MEYKMKVDFNNLRLQVCLAYNSLVKKLNENIEKDFSTDQINIEASYIEADLNDLRRMIVAVACTFVPDNPDFADLSDKIGDFEFFNPEQE